MINKIWNYFQFLLSSVQLIFYHVSSEFIVLPDTGRSFSWIGWQIYEVTSGKPVRKLLFREGKNILLNFSNPFPWQRESFEETNGPKQLTQVIFVWRVCWYSCENRKWKHKVNDIQSQETRWVYWRKMTPFSNYLRSGVIEISSLWAGTIANRQPKTEKAKYQN